MTSRLECTNEHTPAVQRRRENAARHEEYIIIVILTGRKELAVLRCEVSLT